MEQNIYSYFTYEDIKTIVSGGNYACERYFKIKVDLTHKPTH